MPPFASFAPFRMHYFANVLRKPSAGSQTADFPSRLFTRGCIAICTRQLTREVIVPGLARAKHRYHTMTRCTPRQRERQPGACRGSRISRYRSRKDRGIMAIPTAHSNNPGTEVAREGLQICFLALIARDRSGGKDIRN